LKQECAKCHGTSKTGSLVAQGNELCFQCHATTKQWLAKPVVHQPLKTENGCVSCHGPHGGMESPLLVRREESLCRTCHGDKLFKGKTRHEALEDGCMSCHDPHSSTQGKLLVNDVTTLCKGCHEDLSKHTHPTSGGRDPRTGQPLSCTGCHLPHTADQPSLLSHEPRRELCVQCHDPSMMSPKER
jgi:predicted CXXCH cytochrome family protein